MKAQPLWHCYEIVLHSIDTSIFSELSLPLLHRVSNLPSTFNLIVQSSVLFFLCSLVGQFQFLANIPHPNGDRVFMTCSGGFREPNLPLSESTARAVLIVQQQQMKDRLKCYTRPIHDKVHENTSINQLNN